jgi:hypothetical protein
MEHETFWTLLKDSAHWEFELFLIFIFDILIGLLIWPAIRHLIKDHNKFHNMPYKSLAQEKYFHANAKKLSKQGVNLSEWDKASKGLHLSKKLGNKKKKK